MQGVRGVAITAAAGVTTSGATCPYCGNRYMDDSNFCPKSGKHRAGAHAGTAGGGLAGGGLWCWL